ncbi:MAG: methylmalonyl-CoA carboxyltransferase [Acidimicrobiales bacterium]|nr:methylmalonyl-CoA carboxyltransferase [Acidimicrobiales bacterium]|tara:strand:- start:9512 stop:10867 length:1356 start_codon:yes stop_codon:yes gene_type:complete
MSLESNNFVKIRGKTESSVISNVISFSGRKVMQVEIGAGDSKSIKPIDGENLAAAAKIAHEKGMPIICFVESSGADILEGVAAVHGWGAAAKEFVKCSGKVPIIFCVTGATVSGPALLLGLADFVVMVEDSYAFVSGPRMAELFTGENTTNEDLGGAALHDRNTGVSHFTVGTIDEAKELIGQLLSFIPDNSDEIPNKWDSSDPAERSTPEAGLVLPDSISDSYDIRDVINCVVDEKFILESRGSWASNLVTAFASIAGRPVGVVANQPQSMAGTLDIPASQKGASFVSFCDSFNLPLITFVDTSGFYPGKDLEWRGMIRYGAQMAFAYARATVPRICITLRKSYGGAYIVMDSRHMGNDLMLAWPSAEIAVMGAKGAVEILHRDASEEEKLLLESSYEEKLLNPFVAADRGSVDRVIEPAETRSEIAAALDLLSNKKERLPKRKHDNIPL